VRDLVNDVAADAAVLQRLEVASNVDGAETTVTGDNGGDALLEIAKIGTRLFFGQGRVAVGVQIDEAGRHHKAGAVDHARFAGDLELADSDNALAFDGEVADLTGFAAAIVDRGAADHKIGLDRFRLIGGAQLQDQDQGKKHGGILCKKSTGNSRRLFLNPDSRACK
jgi:hypothetical protein